MEIAKTDRGMKASVLIMSLLALFILAFMFFTVGSNQKLFQSKYSLYINLPNIDALNRGAFVTLAGLKVGVVGDIDFFQNEEKQGIRIELKIDEDYREKITESSVATIKTMGILGDKFVDISLGKLNEQPLAENSFLNADLGVDANALFASATAALEGLAETIKNTEQITRAVVTQEGALGNLIFNDEMGKNIHSTTQNIKIASQNLNRKDGNFTRFVSDTTLYSTLLTSSEDLSRITRRIQRGDGTIGQMLADSTFFPKLKAVTQQTDSLLFKLQNGGTTGKLMEDESLYNQLVKLSKTLILLSEDLQKNPGKYVKFEMF